MGIYVQMIHGFIMILIHIIMIMQIIRYFLFAVFILKQKNWVEINILNVSGNLVLLEIVGNKKTNNPSYM